MENKFNAALRLAIFSASFAYWPYPAISEQVLEVRAGDREKLVAFSNGSKIVRCDGIRSAKEAAEVFQEAGLGEYTISANFRKTVLVLISPGEFPKYKDIILSHVEVNNEKIVIKWGFATKVDTKPGGYNDKGDFGPDKSEALIVGVDARRLLNRKLACSGPRPDK